MREPSLRETAVLSLVLHALVFVTALLFMKKASHVTLPSPYVVRLVSPATVAPKKAKAPAVKVRSRKQVKPKAAEKPKRKAAAKSSRARAAKKKAVTLKEASRAPDTVTIEERIAAIRAKKRIEKVVALRKAVLSVKREEQPAAPVTPAGGEGPLLAGYYSLVQERVWSEWVFPGLRTEEGLETVVDIKVLKDGKVKVEGVKKSSGNTLFDRSVLRAIAKASPLPPPPYELEISIRYTP